MGDGLVRSCFWWPLIVLLLVSFLFLLTKLTIFLLYLLSCFIHKLPSRKLFSWGNTRFRSSLFTSFMLAGVLLQVACCVLLDVILWFSCVRVVAAFRVVILLHSLF